MNATGMNKLLKSYVIFSALLFNMIAIAMEHNNKISQTDSSAMFFMKKYKKHLLYSILTGTSIILDIAYQKEKKIIAKGVLNTLASIPKALLIRQAILDYETFTK